MQSFARCAFAPQNAIFFVSAPALLPGRYARDPDVDIRASWPEVLYVGNRLYFRAFNAGDPHRGLPLETIAPD